jgi:acyl carrier protein
VSASERSEFRPSGTEVIPAFGVFAASLAEFLGRDIPAQLLHEDSLIEDLGFDSLEIVHVLVFLESLLRSPVTLADEVVPIFATLGDVYDYLRSRAPRG